MPKNVNVEPQFKAALVDHMHSHLSSSDPQMVGAIKPSDVTAKLDLYYPKIKAALQAVMVLTPDNVDEAIKAGTTILDLLVGLADKYAPATA